MFTILDHFLSPAIVSVQVKASPIRLALVVTSSPALARAVSDYLRDSKSKMVVVWLSTVAEACRRLEWEHADTIFVDASISAADEAIDALHSADPDAQVQVLASGATGS
jgi:hypothetical protein